ncbi:hypothetical protein EST38_g12790 [Candolleomyces aberdarensis]|uniref:Nephrocystin 3-like N-terminal domain-containing protein n=1 Tax=Candolleomyces aberdarensis TaxID=2316362 RepID=A0A4Q2D2P2_9AGAR|nr:hypothetical protein EST38_g12790 [Candolleomyces aberdarensis]
MSEATIARGDNTAGNPERNDQIPSRAATPAGTQSSRNSCLQQTKKNIKKPFIALKRWVMSKMEEDLGEGGDAGSGADGGGAPAASGSGIVTQGGTNQELDETGLGAQGNGATLNVAPSAPEETGSNFPLGQDPASGGLASPLDGASSVLSAAQEITQDSSAAPLSTLGQPEDNPVSITTGGATRPLTTTTIATPVPGTPALPPAGQAGEGAGVSKPSVPSKKTWAIIAGALKGTLSGAVSLIPEPFKGPAQVLLQIFDVFERAKSNREGMEDLKTRCNLLNESMAHAFKRQQDGGSEDLDESVGRLVKEIHDILLATMVEYSTGIGAYVLVEGNAESLKEANRKFDQALQHFWLENFIADALVLSDIYRIVKEQEVALAQNSKKATLHQLQPVSSAAYNSQALATVSVCLEGTRLKLLAGIGRWMSDTTRKPVYVLDGIAGIGKSTVAKTVAQCAAAINSLGCSFFFSRDHAGSQNASSFVHTIAYQLAFCDPSYGEAIAAALDKHPESLSAIVAQQFSAFVAQPLHNLLKQRATPLVFVFDALDECTEGASYILPLIIDSMSQLPQVKPTAFISKRLNQWL